MGQKKNAQKASRTRSTNRKQPRGGRHHKRNVKPDRKFWAGMGFRFPKRGPTPTRDRTARYAADPLVVANDAYTQHHRACGRCNGTVTLKEAIVVEGKLTGTKNVYSPCNRGKAMFRRCKILRGLATATKPQQESAAVGAV
jgi:hypothetical protein